jgi:hypothetical protein
VVYKLQVLRHATWLRLSFNKKWVFVIIFFKNILIFFLFFLYKYINLIKYTLIIFQHKYTFKKHKKKKKNYHFQTGPKPVRSPTY